MLGYLILLFTVVPVVELFLLIQVGQYIGAFSTVAIVIITGVTGAYLAKLQGLITLYRIQEEINQGRMPADRMVDGVIILCSGILLLTPGFLTDLIGFMGLIPATRDLFKRWLQRKLQDMVRNGEVIEIKSFRSL
ncbi:FxsA family protein [Candidatus Omnitrophota bacterium]